MLRLRIVSWLVPGWSTQVSARMNPSRILRCWGPCLSVMLKEDTP
jgi:hypothetical protein